MIGNPIKGVVRRYADSRYIRGDRQGRPYSDNGEVWEPGFIFPYLTGQTARDVFRISLKQVERFLPYHTLRHRHAASRLLVADLRRVGLVGHDGRLDADAFLDFTADTAPSREGTDDDKS